MVKSEVFSYTVGGNVNLCKYYGKQYGSATKKLKIQLPYNPTILFLGITPDKTIIQKGTHLYVHSSTIYNNQDICCCCWVTQSCPTLWNPMDCNTPGFPVLHHLPKQLISIESVMPSNHLVLCHPLLLLPSIFPSFRVFSSELVLHIS